jgi:hypothetical protein
METYATWLKLFGLLRYYSWIVDRFHLSTRAWQIGHGRSDPDFAWLETGLAELGFGIVLCVRQAGSFEAARRDRLQVSGNPRQYDDLSMFVEEQALIRRLAAGSRLPVLELDVSDGDPRRAADAVADWLESRGALCAAG